MSDATDWPDLPMLSSPQNARVKAYVDLRSDGNIRRDEGCFLLEGRRAVADALEAPHVKLRELIFSDHLLNDSSLVRQAEERRIPLVRVSKDVFKKIADVMTPQGIAAVVHFPEWNAAELLARKDAIWAAAIGLQDPGNLGTLIRSCEAAGATGLIMTEGTADPFNAKVVRSTAAGLLNLPILRMKRAELLTTAARHGLRLIATSSHGGTSYKKFDWLKRPLALCIGSEGDGLPEDIAAACNEPVTIPMRGRAESLNAAVAASVLLFEALS